MKPASPWALLTLGALLLAGCAGEPVPEPPAAEPPGGPVAGAVLEGDAIPTEIGDLVIHPISHATFAMSWNGQTVYVDPVGGAEAFDGLPLPDLILITDIHGDHLDAATLEAVAGSGTVIVAPRAVVDQIPDSVQAAVRSLANGEETSLLDLAIEAVPMYNLTEERLDYHERGRGNGYVVTVGGQRVYISGDTEDIAEMRALEDIDVAFVCFNLPYTMTEEQAASAVREFAPRIVYPYHYQGSDAELFTSLVEETSGIEVRMGAWY
jgi:L-ascorbate metabolism protein UlaG (beta-lactamase superfamily)